MAILAEQVAAAPLVGGAQTTLHSHAGGGVPSNVKGAQESTADSVTNAEVLIMQVAAITVSGTNRVLLQAYCEAVNNTGNFQTVGIRVRRGTLITSPLVAECRGQCTREASSPQSLHVVAIDSPGAGTFTYGLFGFNGNYTISYADKGLVAIEVGA